MRQEAVLWPFASIDSSFGGRRNHFLKERLLFLLFHGASRKNCGLYCSQWFVDGEIGSALA